MATECESVSAGPKANRSSMTIESSTAGFEVSEFKLEAPCPDELELDDGEGAPDAVLNEGVARVNAAMSCIA